MYEVMKKRSYFYGVLTGMYIFVMTYFQKPTYLKIGQYPHVINLLKVYINILTTFIVRYLFQKRGLA